MAKSKSPVSTSGRRSPSELKLLGRLWTLHARLFISAAFGVAIALALVALPLRTTTRILLGWDSGVVLYLVLSYRVAGRASIAEIRQRAAINDDGAIALLVLTIAAAVASLAAVLAELGHAPSLYRVALGVGTILLSWIFMHWIFALHYAHDFYKAGDKRAGGLVFPGNQDPDYWDFLYYSLVVAMTAQVSDVQVTGKAIRRLTTVHGVISFFFNVAVLALTINIVSSLMQ
ncbi:MAG: DUF1345 domain-containing protein [Xanthobacteraceae bacterium]